MQLKLTKADLMVSSTAPVGWYPAEVSGLDVKPSADSKSTNITIYFILTGGTQPYQEEFQGKRVSRLFNSKLIGMIVPLLTALGIEVGEGYDLNTDDLKGQIVGEKVDIHIKHREWQGRPQEDVDQYLPAGASNELPM